MNPEISEESCELGKEEIYDEKKKKVLGRIFKVRRNVGKSKDEEKTKSQFNFGYAREVKEAENFENKIDCFNGDSESGEDDDGQGGEINIKGRFSFDIEKQEVTFVGKAQIKTDEGSENLKRKNENEEIKKKFLKKLDLLLDSLDETINREKDISSESQCTTFVAAASSKTQQEDNYSIFKRPLPKVAYSKRSHKKTSTFSSF